jgi:plasmid stabilization system protein ParE
VKILWTTRASSNLDRILEYLEKEWSISSVKKFNNKLLNFLELLKKKPEIGKIVLQDKNIRAFVLTKQNTIFYRLKNNQIIILQLFDNRMNPKKQLNS